MRHFKHVGLSAAAGLLAALACSQPALAAGGTGFEPMTALNLVASTTQSAFIDVDNSSGLSLGDEFVSSGDLLGGSVKVGEFSDVCTVTREVSVDDFDVQCSATFSLAGGDITAEGQATVTKGGPVDIYLAITGGTGIYRTAAGYIEADEVSEKVTDLTVHVIR